jgi:hypothetical protein
VIYFQLILRFGLSTGLLFLSPIVVAQSLDDVARNIGNLGYADYGVCRGTDPRCYHEWPREATRKYRILVYTKTGASRHANLGKVLGPGLNPPLGEDDVAQREMLRIAAENDWDIDYTEDVTLMTSLTGYNAVIFVDIARGIGRFGQDGVATVYACRRRVRCDT